MIRFDAKGFLPAVGLAVVGVVMMVTARKLLILVDDAHDCSLAGDE